MIAPGTTALVVDRAQRRPVSRRLILLLLALVTLCLYLPTRRFDFVGYDDPVYITRNPWVQSGINSESLKWAFTSGYASNWHPVTWLSHMLDWEIYGPRPGGPHLTNVLLHTANVLLLFTWLSRLTGAQWRSAFLAAVFGWHPLRVESVAWISERKDVLCAFFGLLTLMAWARYVRESKIEGSKSKVFYGLALLLFALGLMSKPMLVSLPVILLLLDVWPHQRRPAVKLLLEKVPFFVLSAASCVVTYEVQKSGGAVVTDRLSSGIRVANAIHSYVAYLGKFFWPRDLIVPYLYSSTLPTGEVAAAAVLLGLISFAAVYSWKSRPYLAVGWFWYLVMLVPVIGLVQVGEQAMADRYTYLPAIGISIMVAWLVPELLAGRAKRWICGLGAGAALLGCVMASARQLPYWHDDLALFGHVVKVADGNPVAHCLLGVALAEHQDTNAAMEQFDTALRLRPEYPEAWDDKALLLRMEGRPDEAIAVLRQALASRPGLVNLRRNLARILASQGRYAEAAREFGALIEATPGDPQAQCEMASALMQQGDDRGAVDHLRAALKLKPDDPQALWQLAWIFATAPDANVRDGAEALRLAGMAGARTPQRSAADLDIEAAAYAAAGKFLEAVASAKSALTLANASGQTVLANDIRSRLELYQAGRAYVREPAHHE